MCKNNIYNVRAVEFETCCFCISKFKWMQLMKGAKRADHKAVDRLVKRFEPSIYKMLALNFYNPYRYYRTENHFIVVHSATEYFFKIIK